jgi:hypothetical protein
MAKSVMWSLVENGNTKVLDSTVSEPFNGYPPVDTFNLCGVSS